MHVAQTVQLVNNLCSPSHKRRAYITDTGLHYSNVGQMMQDINQLSLSKNDPRLERVKTCIDKAVQSVLGPQRATVQLQGSTAKGTGLTNSDWDFYVPLHKTETAVTQKERTTIHDNLSKYFLNRGIDYYMQSKSNRIRLWAGGDGSGPLPPVDIVFERFKSDRRFPPNNKLLARSHEAQQVVKYIKLLPYLKTHLPRPKSYLVERFVMSVCEMLHKTEKASS